MGYLHINNLYRPEAQIILQFKELYALEKIHGTSTHIMFRPSDGSIRYFSGGTKAEAFRAIFNEDDLIARFKALALPVDKDITVFGEGYGGKEQGMSATYGKTLKFVAFDVKIGDSWLDVPSAEKVVLSLGLEFVYYKKVSTLNVVEKDGIKHFVELDAERDAPSTQAKRNGILEDKFREGVVLRPLFEVTLNNGKRLIVKHKRDEFRETASPRNVLVDPAQLAVLSKADEVANEWVTNERLRHVLDKMPGHSMATIPQLIKNMTDDVLREGEGEIVDSKEVRKAIGAKAVVLYKAMLSSNIGKA
jgi:hypothetical protein